MADSTAHFKKYLVKERLFPEARWKAIQDNKWDTMQNYGFAFGSIEQNQMPNEALFKKVIARIEGFDFDDEDILGLDTGTSTWSLDYDGSAAFASLAPVDVIAVPEPAAGVSALSGALMIGALLRRRRSGVANR